MFFALLVFLCSFIFYLWFGYISENVFFPIYTMTTSADSDDTINERIRDSLYDFRYYYYTPILNVTIVVSIIAIIVLIVIMSVYSKWSDMILLSSFLGLVNYVLVVGLIYKGMWFSSKYNAASDAIVRIIAEKIPQLGLDTYPRVFEKISQLGLDTYEINHFNKRWRNFNIPEFDGAVTDNYSIGYWFNI